MLDYGKASDDGSREMIDTTIGVRPGARGCAPAEAFEELDTAVCDTQPSNNLAAGEGRP